MSKSAVIFACLVAFLAPNSTKADGFRCLKRRRAMPRSCCSTVQTQQTVIAQSTSPTSHIPDHPLWTTVAYGENAYGTCYSPVSAPKTTQSAACADAQSKLPNGCSFIGCWPAQPHQHYHICYPPKQCASTCCRCKKKVSRVCSCNPQTCQQYRSTIANVGPPNLASSDFHQLWSAVAGGTDASGNSCSGPESNCHLTTADAAAAARNSAVSAGCVNITTYQYYSCPHYPDYSCPHYPVLR